MLVVQGWLDRKHAIINIGVQRFVLDYQAVSANQPATNMAIASYRALLDTGAQRTCLTHRTIAQEGLTRHGKMFIRNVHSENVHSRFLVRLGFWCDNPGHLGSQENDKSYFGLEDPIEVINIADNDRFDAIVGMDVLSHFDFRFFRNGSFEIDLHG